MAEKPFYVDEDTYSRLGYSLLQGHLASASSLWFIYDKLGYVRTNLYTPFGSTNTVEPWLDHPPLIGFLLVPILLTGATPRLLPIIFSSLSTLLIFFLLRRHRLLAWVASLAWVVLFTSHQILSMLFVDAGVSFFNLLTVAMTLEYGKTGSKKLLYLAGITAGASALSKLFGIATLLYLVTYLIYSSLGPRKESIVRNSKPLLLALGTASVWPIYALTIASPLFVQLQLFNAARSLSANNNIGLLLVSAFTYSKSTMYDAGLDLALIAGWAGIVYSLRKRTLVPIHLSLGSYLLVVFVLRYAWYYTVIPTLPFLASGIGVLVSDVIYNSRWQVLGRFKRSENSLKHEPVKG